MKPSKQSTRNHNKRIYGKRAVNQTGLRTAYRDYYQTFPNLQAKLMLWLYFFLILRSDLVIKTGLCTELQKNSPPDWYELTRNYHTSMLSVFRHLYKIRRYKRLIIHRRYMSPGVFIWLQGNILHYLDHRELQRLKSVRKLSSLFRLDLDPKTKRYIQQRINVLIKRDTLIRQTIYKVLEPPPLLIRPQLQINGPNIAA